MNGGVSGVMAWVPALAMRGNGNLSCLHENAFQYDANFSGSSDLGRLCGSAPWTERLVAAVDQILAASVFKALDGIGLDIRRPSPNTAGLPFVKSPTLVVVAITCYLLMVFIWSLQIKRAGLKPRQHDPMPLRCLVVGHNFFLAALSVFMGVGLILEARKSGYSLWGNPYKDDDVKMGFYIYIFYVSKLYEFVDTGIMLLKRNLRQISYLHVYHHASISFIWWIMAYRCPGGDAYFSAAFNSWIHVVMYVYYMLAAIIAKNEAKRRKYLFWGKYLTMMQMFQFMSFIGQAVYGMVKPGLYPKGLSGLLFFYSLSLLLFFSNFFFKKYSRPRQASAHKID